MISKKRIYFERFGHRYSFMPCTPAGCGFLIAFVVVTITLSFVAQAVWSMNGWPGSDFVPVATLAGGVLAFIRFADKRSK